MIAVYGPRLTIIASFGKGGAEFLYDEEKGIFVKTRDLKLDSGKKIFAPGNLRACATEGWYLEALEYWAKNGYTLRYSGGMVPDVNQILKKGGGVFAYPGYEEKPQGKLRLLYECAPCAMIIEQAGGAASNGERRILDLAVEKHDQRTPVFLGSKEEVEKTLSFMTQAR
jgi:fructose-1,6-bisphosphatase I